jgi:tetratricopeptide (TPR) repeat protein
MTKTIVSRSGDFALFVDDEGTTWFYGGANPTPERISVESLHLALDAETPVVEFSDVVPSDVPEVLRRFQHRSDSVHLSLLLLDDTVDSELSMRAWELLDRILSESADAYSHLRSFLHARALPDHVAARAKAHLASFPEGLGTQLLTSICTRQPLILQLASAWDSVPPDVIAADGREAICWAAIERHIPDRLVDLLAAKGPLGPLHFELLQDVYLASIPDSRQFISSWFQLIEQPALFEPTGLEADEGRTIPLPRSKPRPAAYKDAPLVSVDKQKKAILAALLRGKWRLVDRYLRSLEANQMVEGGASYLSKSLCDLATQAQAMYRPDYQLFFAQRAVEVAPDDGWAWAQYAHALLHNGRPDDALDAYNRAGAFGNEWIARAGRADVFRLTDRLEQSLRLYDELISLNPDVAVLGARADVLRRMSRLPEALAAYDETMARHPDDVVVRSGRAETLREMGRLDEALAAYDETRVRHPDNVVDRACL